MYQTKAKLIQICTANSYHNFGDFSKKSDLKYESMKTLFSYTKLNLLSFKIYWKKKLISHSPCHHSFVRLLQTKLMQSPEIILNSLKFAIQKEFMIKVIGIS